MLVWAWAPNGGFSFHSKKYKDFPSEPCDNFRNPWTSMIMTIWILGLGCIYVYLLIIIFTKFSESIDCVKFFYCLLYLVISCWHENLTNTDQPVEGCLFTAGKPKIFHVNSVTTKKIQEQVWSWWWPMFQEIRCIYFDELIIFGNFSESNAFCWQEI